MLAGKVSSKGQVTLPAEVRRRLGLKPGSVVRYFLEGDRAILRKVDATDAAFLKLGEAAFQDWASPEADEAFRDL
jgi:AbrB family looped-hinge helix DNA binding protein